MGTPVFLLFPEKLKRQWLYLSFEENILMVHIWTFIVFLAEYKI
jgi:hypothetical protein